MQYPNNKVTCIFIDEGRSCHVGIPRTLILLEIVESFTVTVVVYRGLQNVRAPMLADRTGQQQELIEDRVGDRSEAELMQ